MASFLKAAFTVVLSEFTGMPSTSCAGSRCMDDGLGVNESFTKNLYLRPLGPDNFDEVSRLCHIVRLIKT